MIDYKIFHYLFFQSENVYIGTYLKCLSVSYKYSVSPSLVGIPSIELYVVKLWISLKCMSKWLMPKLPVFGTLANIKISSSLISDTFSLHEKIVIYFKVGSR